MINYSIQYFWSFFHFDYSNVTDNVYKQKWHMLFFTQIKLMACVLTCNVQSHTSNREDLSIFCFISGCYNFKTMAWCLLAYVPYIMSLYILFFKFIFLMNIFIAIHPLVHWNLGLLAQQAQKHLTIQGKKTMNHTQSHASIK